MLYYVEKNIIGINRNNTIKIPGDKCYMILKKNTINIYDQITIIRIIIKQ